MAERLTVDQVKEKLPELTAALNAKARELGIHPMDDDDDNGGGGGVSGNCSVQIINGKPQVVCNIGF